MRRSSRAAALAKTTAVADDVVALGGGDHQDRIGQGLERRLEVERAGERPPPGRRPWARRGGPAGGSERAARR